MVLTDAVVKPITVVIPTRNRSANLVRAVISILANNYPDFELIIVDQSSNDATWLALQPFVASPRFHYIKSDSVGVGAARNVGIAAARTELIALTDDDCEVEPDWLHEMVAALEVQARVGLVFGNVLEGPYEPTAGFIPTYKRTTPFLACSLKDKNQVRGIGACMGLRRSAWKAVGGFDASLGSGGPLKSNSEGDLAVKMLLGGYYVYETPRLSLIHHGFRTWQEGTGLAWRNWFGIGAAYVKYLRLGHFTIGWVILYEAGQALSGFMISLVRQHRLSKVRPILAFLAGLVTGLFLTIDKAQNNYSSLELSEVELPVLVGTP